MHSSATTSEKTKLEVHGSVKARLKCQNMIIYKDQPLKQGRGAQPCHCECMKVMCWAVFTVYSTWQ